MEFLFVSFQKQKFSNFSFHFFVAYFKNFQISIQISKSIFLFPFPSGGMAKFFKIQKQKISIQI
jgi:hypothetical protein